ncbi:MAG TPA: hypothetical protein VFD58_22850 [Blastocatellia bacterium]|nr:hypothetical protein [Blastocatellia bacterium]
MNNDQNVEQGRAASWELLTLLLSPGSTRAPIIRIDEVRQILELSDKPESTGEATSHRPCSA